ncbi:hypothetical protein [Micromonospora endolithica]|uniref:Phage capsid protein n=1 Tax=Micromonospora endolithica TaxID=230091 RepID=A0A3A9YXM2_9ACTN|nr:hypothetical protein [Micromonospora endolithica]RKN39987.1 hypothetical protein D7223_28035 [Micromonospora endolithica]TWJ26160.1 hypothetical protein JD76_06340 [Micromonospora endolithica]
MARGFNTASDVVTRSGDGTDLATMYREVTEALRLYNGQRDTLRGLLSYNVTTASEDVIQAIYSEVFEEASEYGVPVGMRPDATPLKLGFNFKDFDTATRYTWKFLRDASAEQIRNVLDTVMEADNRQVFEAVLGALLNNAERVNPEGMAVRPLYNGDGTVPPIFEGQTFDGTHTHYITSGAATFDGVDLAALISKVREHGYGADGSQLLALVNPQEAEEVRGFRVGADSPWDFIAGESAPAYLTDQTIVGDTPPAQYGRLALIGGFGPAYVAETHLMPAGYVLVVASDGANGTRNPVGFRQHPRSEYQGLRSIPGPSPDYPLQHSYYQRSFGTGVRHRGAAAVMQVTTNVNYATPVKYARVVA